MTMNSSLPADLLSESGSRSRLSTQIYLVRVIFGSMTALLLAVNDASCQGQPGAHPFLLLVGLSYPHLGQLLLGRLDDDLRHGRALFVLDGLYAGAVIGALEFSGLPSLVILVICLFNWMIVGGISLIGLGLALMLLGALMTGNLPAITAGVIPASCKPVLWLAAGLFVLYFLIVAYVIHMLIGTLQRQQAALQAYADAAHAARGLAERALLSAFPRSVARQMETTGRHTPEILPAADLMLIELAGFETPPADLVPLQTTWRACETILARHGIELIKTCGIRGIALGRGDAGLDGLIAAAREILTYFSDHPPQSAAQGGNPQRVLIHRGAATLGLVQPARLDLDLSGPGLEALLTLADRTAALAPRGLLVSPAAHRLLQAPGRFAPLPAGTEAPACYLERSELAA